MDDFAITALFLDIGGVLLTNGWDRPTREKAAQYFHLDYPDLEERHHLTYDTYEEGKLSLDEYLQRVIFYTKRNFSVDNFKYYMLNCSRSVPEMIQLIKNLKAKYRLKTLAVNNEGREINAYRIETFHLAEVIDTFVSSCYVHYRKPDADIYRIALDISQSSPDQVVYIDDRPLFVEVAKSLGINGILHTGFKSTREKLNELGLISNLSGEKHIKEKND